MIFHSDRGCQYTSHDYAALAAELGVTLSLGRKGECWDNAVSESWFATFKNELINTRPWPTRAGLRPAVFEYIEGWYNTGRIHSSLGYRSPSEYEATSTRRPPPRRHNQHTNPVRQTGLGPVPGASRRGPAPPSDLPSSCSPQRD